MLEGRVMQGGAGVKRRPANFSEMKAQTCGEMGGDEAPEEIMRRCIAAD